MQSITLPHKPKTSTVSKEVGKFEIEGCYPGYGTTLGNSLRRVLLSSLSGTAITSVKIKGVDHEFSTISGVLEDVIQIILNLKQVRFKSYKDEPIKAVLKAKGEKEINAGMFKCSSDLEVVTKDAHIATITNAKCELEIEIEVENGIGYVPVEQQEKKEKEVGVIAVDAIYTPIRRVNYSVENMRVGKRTDFEKITLEISTDGSITPQEAFSSAVKILVDQFSVMLKMSDPKEEKKPEEKKIVAKKVAEKTIVPKEDPKKNLVVDLKGLSARTLNVLEKGKISSIADIIKMTESELNDLEGMGAKGIKEIKKATGDFGLNLKQDKQEG
ncbi:MAG: DNA-directed RNA polymerase subunit alpha [Candidatus Moranbacteria bacterium CG10_big_fil_rev_8_21_14_0_10_35_21]|nr:MAG: DNA-directed RNA polymerase subunit alpha [Candidatus Moranbacteria bacterium CG10_big_fil_rev_8_21_14_0_10_35_21]PJA88517.1 MAG: DNA-directed RNA polymerase subunit alpha [Candidatus Moranbacteria bacterium CG_4_9_14_3_um_filter_36_9]